MNAAFIVYCALLMWLKGRDAVGLVSNKVFSAVLFATAVFFSTSNLATSLVAGGLWLLGIAPGLPELGKLRENDRSVILQTCQRGLWNSALLGFCFSTPQVIYCGILMPLCYKVGFTLEDTLPKIFRKGSRISGWAVGEILFGALLGAAMVL